MSNSKIDIEEAKKIIRIFADISEDGQIMAIAYLSALRDKEIADKAGQSQEA